MTQNTALVPAGRKSVGNTKQAVGVIEEGLVPNGELLERQASAVAQNIQGAVAYTQGMDFPEELIRSVEANSYRGVTNLNQATLDALQNGTITRDQAFVGNNANFTGYYLEPAAKYVIPQLTPLRNMTPRVAGVGIDTINWRAITDYFGGTGPTVATAALQQQSTPTSLTYNWVNASNVMKMLSVKDVVTFEAELYGRMFQGDVRATVAAKLIPALMQEQEFWMINSGQRLWAPPPPSNATTAATGGTVAAATYWFAITAANANGETLADGGLTTPTLLSITTTGATSTITFNIFRVPSATKYNVYCGSGSTAPATSALWLQSATTQFGGATALNDVSGLSQGYITVTMTVPPATSGTAYSTLATNTAIVVKSTDANTLNLPLTYSGVQDLIYLNRGTPSTIMVGGETPFIRQPASASGSLTLSDMDTLLENMFLNSKADPDYIFVSVKDHKKLSQLVAQGTNFRVTVDMDQGQDLSQLIGGQRVTRYINQTTGKLIDIVMLPYLMQGTIIVGSFTVPFPVSAFDKPVWRIEYNRDMWAIEYPPDQSHYTQWAYSAFCNECPVLQYLGGWALLTGITTS